MAPEVTKEDLNRIYDRLDELDVGVAVIQNEMKRFLTKDEYLRDRLRVGNPGTSKNSERWWLRLIIGIGTIVLAAVGLIALVGKVIYAWFGKGG